MRFDVRGMGDAQGDLRNFEGIHEDIHAAIDAFMATVPKLRGVVLMGLCDGASASLMYLDSPAPDPRVMGMVLLNPWVRSDETLAKARVRHYYRDRLVQKEFWLKLLQGRVAWGAVTGLWRNLIVAARGQSSKPGTTAKPVETFQQRMRRSWQTFPGPILLMLSGKDYTAKEFEQVCSTDAGWKTGLQREQVKRVDMPDADHTISTSRVRIAMELACVDWMRGMVAPRAASEHPMEDQPCHTLT
jgi:exosortase A-associated hydrolase 1